jgi:hypothetical protein
MGSTFVIPASCPHGQLCVPVRDAVNFCTHA